MGVSAGFNRLLSCAWARSRAPGFYRPGEGGERFFLRSPLFFLTWLQHFNSSILPQHSELAKESYKEEEEEEDEEKAEEGAQEADPPTRGGRDVERSPATTGSGEEVD